MKSTFAVCMWFSLATPCHAELFTYLDEDSYLTALAARGYVPVHEGFEDDTAWGSVRTTITGGQKTSPSITNLGVTWKSNNVISEITTGAGAARTGDWGFFALPHGDFDNVDPADDIPDGFMGTSPDALFGIGGWIRTNTPPAEISLYIDSVLVDFDVENAAVLGTAHKFFGVIDTDGFSEFLWQETEGTRDDQKYIFADDFTLARVPEPSSIFLLGSCAAICLTGWSLRRASRAIWLD